MKILLVMLGLIMTGTGAGFTAPKQDVLYDLLLKGGHVIDPANGRNSVLDVAVRDNHIALVDRDIPASSAAEVIDVSGYFVTPGLIDIHVHVDYLAWDHAVKPEPLGFTSGVTTMVDAGTTGWITFPAFKKRVIDQSPMRVLAFLNVVDMGMVAANREQVVANMQPEATAAVARQYSDVIVGIKTAHYWTSQPWDADHPPWAAVDAGVEAGRLAGMPLMVDFWPRPPERPYAELILEKMRPGDIHTHLFAQQFPILLEDGSVNPILQQAQDRGVLLDVGHGAGSFWFRNGARAIRQEFRPNTISTDLHMGNYNGKVVNFITTMSKFLVMGVPLEEVIAMSTTAPAKAINRPELGTLSTGAEADLAVIEERRGTFGYVDCGGAKLTGDRKLEAVLTVRAGRIVYNPQGMGMPEWVDAPPAYWFTPKLQGQQYSP